MANFLAEKSSKKKEFKAENNTRIIPKQLPNNLEKVQETTFLSLKIIKITLFEG